MIINEDQLLCLADIIQLLKIATTSASAIGLEILADVTQEASELAEQEQQIRLNSLSQMSLSNMSSSIAIH